MLEAILNKWIKKKKLFLPSKAGRKTVHSPTMASLRSTALCLTVNFRTSASYKFSEKETLVPE
jgi:hypothetical protein